MNSADPRELALEYLLASRSDPAAAEGLERRLAALTASDLRRALDGDASRLAFWIDVYNGAVLRRDEPDFRRPTERLLAFRRPAVSVAGQSLSLDAIEHGILRRSRWKLGFGYLGNPLPSRFERAHRVRHVDPRIHFALNCGVTSCPPIAAYRAGLIDEQLDLATRSYLATEVKPRGDGIEVPVLLLWYAGDFGGAPGMRRFLRHYDVNGWNRPISFGAYDWTPAVGRWSAGED